ncbi:MAG: hypothetical protein ACXV2F_04155 [Halobacteriota archaeon]
MYIVLAIDRHTLRSIRELLRAIVDAYAVAGRYRLQGDKIRVAVHLFRCGNPEGDFQVEGNRADVEELAAMILEALLKKLTMSDCGCGSAST